MPANVTVLAGPAGSGKTLRLLDLYRAALRANDVGTTLWLAPTQRAAREVYMRLLDGDLRACFAPAIMTFTQFAEQILATSDALVHPVSNFGKRQIVRGLIQSQARTKRLRHFSSIADTSGLIDQVSEFISELKRHEIWPEHFVEACRRRSEEAKDRELASLYSGYQEFLQANQLYDAEGRFWTARELLRDAQPWPFGQLRLVVADGFTDFTRTQHEILHILSQRVDHMFVSLPLEADNARSDLFSKPRRTLAQLRSNCSQVHVEELPRASSTVWPALSHIERELFKNPRLVRRASNAAQIEVIEAARANDEIYLVARRIKQLLVEGDDDSRTVAPQDVAMVFRSLGGHASRIRSAFVDLGIPFSLDQGRALTDAPAIASLLALVRLHVEDWPFRAVLALINNNYFAPDWPEWHKGSATHVIERAIRLRQVARLRKDLLASLHRTANAPSNDSKNEAERARAQTCRADARTAHALLSRLASALGRLPNRATTSQWATALIALATETGLTTSFARHRTDLASEPAAELDRAAWDSLVASLTTADRLSMSSDREPETLDAAAFLDLLVDIARFETIRDPHDEVGRVRVLSASSVRALSIPYLFFAGLSEKAFPPPDRIDRLYSEAEYQQLSEAGLPLVLRAERSQEEMLLFYEVVTRARRHLCLSYPGLDDKGQPLLPSPYLGEVEQLFDKATVRRFKIEDLSPIPHDGRAYSAREQRILGMAQAADNPKNGALLASLAARSDTLPTFRNLLAGLQSTGNRSQRDSFGIFEGMVESTSARQWLTARFGDQCRWSASRLEQYANCPFQFFMENVLAIKPLDDVLLETDYLSRGSRLHALLAVLHAELNRSRGAPTSPTEESAAYRQLVERLLAELWPEAIDGEQPFEAALREIDRRTVEQWLDDYARQHAAYDALWGRFDTPLRPAHFEVSFGEEKPTSDPLSTSTPLTIAGKHGQVLVQGRIDRIDLGAVGGKPVFNVLDYKSGKSAKFKKDAIHNADVLQVALYAMAAEQLFAGQGRVPWQSGYWFIADGGFPKKQSLDVSEHSGPKLQDTAEWIELRAKVTERVLALVAAVRSGEFPVASRDAHCTSYCQYHTVCRINQVRSLEKTWQPRHESA